MAALQWDDSFSVGIKSIDKQHQKLIDSLNDFYAHIESKSNDELIGSLLSEMRNYVEHHFATEEMYFKNYNYPEYEKHKREHTKFIEKLVDLEQRFNNGTIIASFEITTFLKNWLVNHIKGTDKEYSQFLIDKGVV